MYKIIVKRKVEKQINKLPKNVKNILFLLIEELKVKGAVRNNWNNYSKLGKNKYHCHLSYRYVTCWKVENDKITIEVYYAGSREKAPY